MSNFFSTIASPVGYVLFILIIAIIIFFVWKINSNRKQRMRKLVHDIRTKLSIIKTHSELHLLQGNISDAVKETMKSNIEEIHDAIQILDKIKD